MWLDFLCEYIVNNLKGRKRDLDQMNRIGLDRILGKNNRNCSTMEHLRRPNSDIDEKFSSSSVEQQGRFQAKYKIRNKIM